MTSVTTTTPTTTTPRMLLVKTPVPVAGSVNFFSLTSEDEQELRALQELRERVEFIAQENDFSDDALATVETYVVHWERLVNDLSKSEDELHMQQLRSATWRASEDGDDGGGGGYNDAQPMVFAWRSSIFGSVSGRKARKPGQYTSVMYEWLMATVLLGVLQFHRARNLHVRARQEFPFLLSGQFVSTANDHDDDDLMSMLSLSSSVDLSAAATTANGSGVIGANDVLKFSERVQRIAYWYGRASMTLRYAETQVLERWRYPAPLHSNEQNEPETHQWYFVGFRQLIRSYVYSVMIDQERLKLAAAAAAPAAEERLIVKMYLCAVVLLDSPEVGMIHSWTERMAAQAYTRAMLMLHNIHNKAKQRDLQVAVLDLALNRRGLDDADPLYAEVKQRRQDDAILYPDRKSVSRTDERLPRLPDRKTLRLELDHWTEFKPAAAAAQQKK